MVALIRRSFSYLDGPLFRKIFTTYVRKNLDYGQITWTPYLKKTCNHSATCTTPSYETCGQILSLELRKLNLPSLVYRRTRDKFDRALQKNLIELFFSYQKISHLERVLVENTTTNCCVKLPKIEQEDSRRISSTSGRSKLEISFQKKLCTLRLSTHLRTNQTRRGSTCQKVCHSKTYINLLFLKSLVF